MTARAEAAGSLLHSRSGFATRDNKAQGPGANDRPLRHVRSATPGTPGLRGVWLRVPVASEMAPVGFPAPSPSLFPRADMLGTSLSATLSLLVFLVLQ